MGIRRALALAPLLAFVASPAAVAAPDEKPFPVARGVVLKEEGVTYYVEGRQRIPKGVEITLQKDTKLVGRGDDPVLEVEGALMVCGVTGKEVEIENLWIEPQAKFTDVRLDTCTVRGKGGIRTVVEGGVDGRLFVEGCTFLDGATVQASLSANQVDLHSTHFYQPVTLKALVPPGAKATKAAVFLHKGCYEADLSVEGFADTTVRAVVIRGGKATFKDCGKFTFDANRLEVNALEIRYSDSGRFKNAKMEKCDVYRTKILLWAPVQKNLNELLVCDKCWFNGVTDDKKIRETVFTDGDDDPACGVKVKFQKINETKLDLASGDRK